MSGTTWVGKVLSTTAGTWVATPAPAYTYGWQRCTAGTTTCADIVGATKASYTIVAADKSKQLRAKVTAKNSAGSVIAYSLNTTTVIQPVPPANTKLPTVTGTLVDGAKLTAKSGTWTGSPAPAYTYQWQRCTVGICAATGASGTTYVLSPADVGRGVAVLVTATNIAGSAAKQSLTSAAVKALPPTNSAVPTVIGVPTSGTQLASTPGTWTGTPPVTFIYQWQRCDLFGQGCSNIAGATGATYVPSGADVTNTVRVAVTGANASGIPGTATSTVTAAVVGGANPPANIAPPAIDDTVPSDGDTLTAISGEWSGATAFFEQWQSCDADGLGCQDISGATGTSYVVQPADVDHTIVVREEATNDDGNSLAVSPPTAVVAPVPPAHDPASPPRIVGRASIGSTLTALPGGWTGTPAVGFTYQWESSPDGATWSPVIGADAQTYLLGPTDVGQRLHVIVTATNEAPGSDVVTSPGAGPVVAAGVLWGMSDSWADDGVRFDATEQQLGRTMTLVREYHRLGQPFVSPREQALVDSGHSMVISVRAQTPTGTLVPYANITAGLYDGYFSDGLAELNQLATPAYFIFQHEADGSSAKKSCSTTVDATCGAEFVAAWRHIYALAKAAGDDNVHFVWTVTAYDFSAQSQVKNNNYWPGAGFTDWIGVDQYNGGCSGRYMSFSEMLASSIAWTQAHAPELPVMVVEWGATEGSTPTAKAGFFAAVPAALAQPGYTQIQALVYWNDAPSGTCSYRVTTTAASLAAFTALGLSPIFAQSPLPGTGP